jgi:transposase
MKETRVNQPIATFPAPSPYLHETNPKISPQLRRMRNRINRELIIKDLVDSGATLRQMAARFQVTNGRIGQILKKMKLKTLRARQRRPNRKKPAQKSQRRPSKRPRKK